VLFRARTRCVCECTRCQEDARTVVFVSVHHPPTPYTRLHNARIDGRTLSPATRALGLLGYTCDRMYMQCPNSTQPGSSTTPEPIAVRPLYWPPAWPPSSAPCGASPSDGTCSITRHAVTCCTLAPTSSSGYVREEIQFLHALQLFGKVERLASLSRRHGAPLRPCHLAH